MKNIVYRVSLVKRRFPVSLPSSVSFELLSTIDDVHESPVAKNHGGSLMTKNERSEWKFVRESDVSESNFASIAFISSTHNFD